MPAANNANSSPRAKESKAPAWLTEIAAPAILIGGATAYFAGNVFHDTLLGKYGLKGAAVQWSVQQTIAYGYYALLRSLIPTTLAILVGITIRYVMDEWLPGFSNFGWLSREHRRFFNFINGVCAALIFAALGYIAGLGVAEVEYRNVEERVADHCKQCFVYRGKFGQVVGLSIGQDDKNSVIVTRRGIVVLAAGSIVSVVAINRQRPKTRWQVI